jgi:hypothetical protein
MAAPVPQRTALDRLTSRHAGWAFHGGERRFTEHALLHSVAATHRLAGFLPSLLDLRLLYWIRFLTGFSPSRAAQR